ncbi:hypothetical protein FRB93_007518 [Tulasnella sp. JGI-2019a]|nr:hypothetical protein FRB93_007518 [Tulasnella sp. JGI-2019a]
MSSSIKAASPQLPVHRIVTKHTECGQSTHGIVDHITPVASNISGVHGAALWTTDKAQHNDLSTQSDDAAKRVISDRFGLVVNNGSNLRVTDLPPGSITPLHRTHSVDYNILIHGSVFHITEDGTETHLTTPGATLIQRGTMHAWENRGTEWARYISVLIDAEPISLPDSRGKLVPAPEVMSDGWVPPSRKKMSSKL